MYRIVIEQIKDGTVVDTGATWQSTSAADGAPPVAIELYSQTAEYIDIKAVQDAVNNSKPPRKRKTIKAAA